MEYGANLNANVELSNDVQSPPVAPSAPISSTTSSYSSQMHNSPFAERPESIRNPIVSETMNPVVSSNAPSVTSFSSTSAPQRNRDRAAREPKSNKNLV